MRNILKNKSILIVAVALVIAVGVSVYGFWPSESENIAVPDSDTPTTANSNLDGSDASANTNNNSDANTDSNTGSNTDTGSNAGDSSSPSKGKPDSSANPAPTPAPAPKPEPGPKPAPAPKPEPAPKPAAKTVTISIDCATILKNMDKLDAAKKGIIPSGGVVMSSRKVEFTDGESVFDVLTRETKNNGIHMEFAMSPVYKSAYVEGINNIYEFDCGPLSGWMYNVNGSYPNYGCSVYKLKDGDSIQFKYTCDLGSDLGAPQ